MKKIFRNTQLCMATLACTLLLACESPPKSATVQKPPPVKPKEVKPATPPPAPAATEAPRAAPATPAANADVQALKEGMTLYNDGEYNAAIKKLSNATEIWSGHNKTIQVSALKYMAFSYCVTSKALLCRQQFEKALKIDQSFDLMPSEIGHPIWGPVFQKAKKAKH